MRKISWIGIILLLIMSFSGKNVSAAAPEVEVELTQEEQQFIKDNPVIHLGVDSEFVPYEFIDSDGVYKGIASDYIKLLSQKTGLEMVVEPDKTWEQAYMMVVEKQLDVLPCIARTIEREQYFLFSEPYYKFQRVIVVSTSNKQIKGIQDLHNQKVAVQVNSSHHSYLKNYPDIELSFYNTVEEALSAVSNGTETVFVGNLATSSYLIKTYGLTELKFVNIDDEESQSLYFAVRNDWPLLVSIINKGLAAITEEEKIEINNRWIGVDTEVDYGPLLRIFAAIGAVIIIIFIVSVYWIVKLKKEVAKRKRTEDELRQAKEDADSANRIKSSFLARMSHEIRTPLNAITGMAYLIKKTDVTMTQRIYVDKITQAANNMLGIINDILDFSKIEAGKIEIERTSFNLDKVLQDVMSIVAFKIEEQKISFSLFKEPKIPSYFFGDSKRLEQILLNVISNAVKFTNKGEVSLSIHITDKSESIYMLEFNVKDTGIGMSTDQLNQLFSPFSQADASINRRFGGTGLGLSIVKNLVEMMSGSIQVSSVFEEGSTFVIKLPMEVDQEKVFDEKQKNASLYFKNIKAIVLDKSIADLNLLEIYLKSFGIKAVCVTSENQVESMLEESYDLLILDYETPEAGGFEYIRSIKNNPKITTELKTIIMLPLMREDLFEKTSEYGIEIGVTKPIIPSVLYDGILEIFKLEHFSTQEKVAKSNDVASRMEKTYQVLVVEDNKTNQFIAKSILEPVGFAVSLTDNGAEGFDYFKNHQGEVDLILMDLHMPVMNGYDASTRIRELDSAIPIVAMTADAVSGVAEACQAVGINHYISKPFDPDKLVETLVDIIKNQPNSKMDKLDTKPADENNGLNDKILDEADGLKRIGNNKELYKMILAEYLNENKDIAQDLELVMHEKNYIEAIQIVHKNKGGSGNIGAKKLYETAMAFQKALENQDESEIERLHMMFKMILDRVLKEISEKLR